MTDQHPPTPDEIAAIRAKREKDKRAGIGHSQDKHIDTLLAAVDQQAKELAEYKTLAKVGTWHNECRPNRHQAAAEIEKGQAVINKLADTVQQQAATIRTLREAIAKFLGTNPFGFEDHEIEALSGLKAALAASADATPPAPWKGGSEFA